MITVKARPSWAVRAAKLFSISHEIVLIRFADEFESVEIVHSNSIGTRQLLEAAQMAIVRVLARVP